MARLVDLQGIRFGKLIVIEKAESKNGHTRWLCKCDCGKETLTHATSLVSGNAMSCGCLSHQKMKEANTKHGYRHTQLYSSWCAMKKRCYNPKYDHFNCYGGKGIKICAEWVNDFIAFKDWAMINGYKEGLEIDRKDVNGDYEPSNCKWSNRVEQVRNRTNTVFIEHYGEVKTLKEWSEIYNISYKLAHARYKKGWCFSGIFE